MGNISLLFLATISTLLIVCPSPSAAARPLLNVRRFGATPDGRTDSTAAFLTTWRWACASRRPVTMLVPKGRFLVRNMQFAGPCKNRSIFVRIVGTLVAPTNIWTTGNKAHWIDFHRVNGVIISGGVLDGKGGPLWACKKSGRSCPRGATTLSISNSQNVVVSRLTSLNSHMFHMVINFCHRVKVQGVRISAPGNSPNTDGIHVQFSTAVSIVNTRIATGDDCVSIGPGTANLLVDRVACGPGHGISIGSLGKDVKEQGVQNVTVKSTVFMGTTNGFRIKAWENPSNGFARNILFQHATMYNVQNPIIIDQRYCPARNCPGGRASGVRVSDVTYQNIRGTSATQVAVKFDCSSKSPCTGIRLNDVRLTYRNRPAVASCKHAAGTAYGFVQPTSCL